MQSVDNLCRVYWIRLPEHTDIFTQGYVGVTTLSIDKRFQQHKYQARKGSKYIINKAIRKYWDNIVIETILISTTEYCLDIENKLRPSPYIGWNSSIGGKTISKSSYSTPDDVKIKISESVKKTYQQRPWLAENTSKRRKGTKLSDETKLKMSQAKKDLLPWENSQADKQTWLKADNIYNIFKTFDITTQKQLSNHTNIPYPKLKRIFIKLKDNWNPLEDQKWLDFKDKYIEENK